MTRLRAVNYEFVHLIPEVLTHGTVYISINYATASHLCCCGCGYEVVTPLTPTDWNITFDGESISLHPSIGNWAFECQSHYWIRRNTVEWARRWTPEQIEAGRQRERLAKKRQFGETEPAEATAPPAPETHGLLARLRRRLLQRRLG